MSHAPAAASPRLSIVLPTYNEEARIGDALEELLSYLNLEGGRQRLASSAGEPDISEVLVVDDGSADRTVQLVEARIGAGTGRVRMRLLREPHRGKGGAVRAGMLAATGQMVVFTDADMATPPDQLPKLVEALASHDIALGSRIQPDGTDRRASQPTRRRLMGKAFHFLAAAWVTGPVPDTQCGFKGFRAAAAQDLFARQRLTSIVFDAEIIHLARRRGYSMTNVPVEWTDKTGSRMQVRLDLAVRVFVDLARIPLIHRRVRQG
jgi:glycosyltransferase involved in cell wall biosynthesis